MVRDVGLSDLRIEEKPDYVEAMTEWDDPLFRKIVENLPAGTRPGDYIVSVNLLARKIES